MPTMDQVAWANVNVMVAGQHQSFGRGELLPEPATAEEAANRSLLRLGGALRVVEVVYTAEELAEQAMQRGQASAAREAALDTDPDVPMGDQVTGGVAPGLPTIVEPSGSPVVIGDEDLRAEHEAQRGAAEAARARAADAGRPPRPNAAKAEWVDYAERRGQDRAEAEGMTRNQLAAMHGTGTVSGPPLAADRAAQAESADLAARRMQGAEQGVPVGDATPAPGPDASDEEWRDYAVGRGADHDQVQTMDRDQLIAAYGPPSQGE